MSDLPSYIEAVKRGEPVHSGRSWTGSEIEDACPCPKEACGLVNLHKADPDCPHHAMRACKTMRQGHPESKCPGLADADSKDAE